MKKLAFNLLSILAIWTFFSLPSIASDYFSDNFNDNHIDTNKWSLWSGPNNTIVKEGNRVLSIDYPPISSWGGLSSKKILTGDFAIKMEYDNWEFSGHQGPYYNDVAQVGMEVQRVGNNINNWEGVYEFRGWFPNGTDRFVGNGYYDGEWHKYNEPNVPSNAKSSGILTIERENGDIRTYYSDLNYSNFTLLTEHKNAFYDPVRINLRAYTGDHTNDFHAEWDNIYAQADYIRDDSPTNFGIFIGVRNDDFMGDVGANLFRNTLIDGGLFERKNTTILTGEHIGKNQIFDAISDFQSEMIPGDTLWFYFAGHGTKLLGSGGETTSTPEDEAIVINSNNEYLTDDTLSALDFMTDLKGYWDENAWDQISKLFILDSCHSGGFWGNNSGDTGDLEKLDNVALFAAAKEDSLTYYDKDDTGYGFYTEALIDAYSISSLGYFYADGNRDNKVSKSELDTYIDEWISKIDEKRRPDPFYISEQDFGERVLFSKDLFSPISYKSDDFIGQLGKGPTPVPEPSTFLLLSAGLIGISVIRKKTRKNTRAV